MSKYPVKGGRFFSRTVQIGQENYVCHGCPATILKGEFYIRDTLSETNTKYGYTAYGSRPTTDLIKLSWHMACAPLTRESTQSVLKVALKETTRQNPARLEAAKDV